MKPLTKPQMAARLRKLADALDRDEVAAVVVAAIGENIEADVVPGATTTEALSLLGALGLVSHQLQKALATQPGAS